VILSIPLWDQTIESYGLSIVKLVRVLLANGEGVKVTNTIRIAASILAADFTRLGQHLQDAEAAGAGLIHIDVMDGRFVPNITMGPLVVDAARRSTDLPLDVHLMMVEPEHLLSEFAQAGASAITVHWEACPNLHRSLQVIKMLGCGAGVAINPHTPPSFLSEVLHMIDVVNVMTVNPGFGGQKFLPETLPKIRRLREMITASGRQISLEVDGGINHETARTVVDAGADVLIAGSAVFNNTQPVQASIDILKRSFEK
jgi:ribulose-phosphate 3-epimerase